METMNVRLTWLDDRTPSMIPDVDIETTEIVVTLRDGNHYFRTTDEVAIDGFTVFREFAASPSAHQGAR